MKVTTEIQARQILDVKFLVFEYDGTMHKCSSCEDVVAKFSYLMSHSTGVQNSMEHETGDTSALATVQSMQINEDVSLTVNVNSGSDTFDTDFDFTVLRLA